MTYLDHGATSFHKPESVYRAVRCALENCANPGRGGYKAAMIAAKYNDESFEGTTLTLMLD